MRDTIRFGDFVEVNPSIRLERGKEYSYVEMADVTPSNAFVYPLKNEPTKAEAHDFKLATRSLPALRLV